MVVSMGLVLTRSRRVETRDVGRTYCGVWIVSFPGSCVASNTPLTLFFLSAVGGYSKGLTLLTRLQGPKYCSKTLGADLRPDVPAASHQQLYGSDPTSSPVLGSCLLPGAANISPPIARLLRLRDVSPGLASCV